MKNVLISFSVLAILAFAGCKKSYSPSVNSGHVMFVNACNGSGEVFVASKNALVFSSNVTSYPGSISYLGSSRYQSVPTGIDSIFFTLDAYDTLSTGTITVAQDNFYSVFAAGSLASPTYLAIPDLLPQLSAGNAEVRLVNLSTDITGKTATVGTTLISANPFAYSSFRDIPQGTYSITVGDNKNANQASISGVFGDGKIYTIIIMGSVTSAVTLAIIDNNQLLN